MTPPPPPILGRTSSMARKATAMSTLSTTMRFLLRGSVRRTVLLKPMRMPWLLVPEKGRRGQCEAGSRAPSTQPRRNAARSAGGRGRLEGAARTVHTKAGFLWGVPQRREPLGLNVPQRKEDLPPSPFLPYCPRLREGRGASPSPTSIYSPYTDGMLRVCLALRRIPQAASSRMGPLPGSLP